MKVNRHGRAKVLTQSEIQLIFSDDLDNDRDGNENAAGIALVDFLSAAQKEGCNYTSVRGSAIATRPF